MGIKNGVRWTGKILLLVGVLIIALSVLGCTGLRNTPQGGSGGTVANTTLFLCPALAQAGGFGCSPAPSIGKLIALDITNGNRVWDDVTLEGSRASGTSFGCTPSVTPAAIYGKPALSEELVYIGGYNGKVYAVTQDSGAIRWVYPREGNLEPIIGGVVVSDDKLYFGCSDGKVYALDSITGDAQWEFLTGDKIWATPAVEDGALYIGSFDKKLYALDTLSGEKKWEFTAGGAIASTPLVYEDAVYFGSFDRYFYAVDALTGKLEWKFKAEKWFWTKASAFNGTVYAGCFDDKLYAFDAVDGAVVTTFNLGSAVYAWPVMIDEALIIASEDGEIYSIDLASNQSRLLVELKENVFAPLSASEGVVYVYTQKHNLYALSAESGATLWTKTID